MYNLNLWDRQGVASFPWLPLTHPRFQTQALVGTVVNILAIVITIFIIVAINHY